MRVSSGAILFSLMILLWTTQAAAGSQLGNREESRWQANVHYLEISKPVAAPTADGRIDVVEVFWYSCPHCFALEEFLAEWVARTSSDVHFSRLPAQWKSAQMADARLYFVLMTLARLDMHSLVYRSIHIDRTIVAEQDQTTRFVNEEGLLAAYGVPVVVLAAAAHSKEVEAGLDQARRLVQAYQVVGTPTIVINGRYITDPSRAGSGSRLIALVDFLVEKERARLLDDAKQTRDLRGR